MILLAVLLGVLAVAGLVVAAVTMSRLGDQRAQTAAAEQRSAQQASELAATVAALEAAGRAKEEADEQVAAARAEAELAAAARHAAEERAAAAEQRVAEFAAARAAAEGGLDPDVLWTLEQARSERTWRQSVAPGPDAVSVFADASDPLLEALQVELDAAREDVGAIVELEVDLPPGVTAAGSVLALRAAQELLAGVVRRGEVTTLHVRADGQDLVVAVRSVDEDGQPVPTDPLALPTSVDIEPVEDGVRIRDAIRPVGNEEPAPEDP